MIDELLTGFEGTLVTDGYPAYDSFVNQNSGVTHAQCWMHNRRQYVYAEQDEPQAVAQALEIMGGLFHHEQCIKDQQLEGQAALQYRSRHCKPIV